MAKARHPRRGSMQFWPRSRTKHTIARVRSWADKNDAKPLGFIGFKAGMTHVMMVDERAKSHTKGDTLAVASTIVECPPMHVAGVVFYQKWGTGVRKSAAVLASNLSKSLSKTISLPKKQAKTIDSVTEFDDLRLLVHTNPAMASTGAKKPKLREIALGGSKDDKLAYAKEQLGKQITIGDVFSAGNPVDVHGITKGKGFQGTVKRYGVPIKQHKGEKNKRGIGNLGAWTPKRVDYRVPQPGKMGFHLRTEYNKQILAIGEKGEEVTPKGGLNRYGVVKNNYLLIKGSVVGPKKREVLLAHATRPTKSTQTKPANIKLIAK